MDNMNKGIKFDFSKTEVITNKLRWIKTLKEVFCINLRDAKDAVDCGTYFHNLSEFSYKNDAIKFYNTIFTIFPGTTITFLGVFPSKYL